MTRSPPSSPTVGLLALWGLALACGGDAAETPAGPATVSIRSTGAPLPAVRSAPLPASAEALGVTGDGTPVIASSEGVLALGPSSLEPRRLFAGPGDPVLLGTVRALAPRREGGAWLGSDVGLFTVDRLYVLPLSTEPSPISAVAEVAEGPLAGVWLLTAEALYLSTEAALDRFAIPDLLGPLAGLAVDPAGRRAITFAGPETLLLEPVGRDLDVWPLPVDVGAARAVAASESGLWVAAEAGLFVLPAESGPEAWAEVRVDGAPVDAVTLASEPSGAFALDRAGRLLALDLDEAAVLAEGLPTSARLSGDGRGGAWVAADGSLDGYRIDAPSFAADVRPFVETHCARCHGDPGADYRDYAVFAPRAEAALDRVRAGDMPRCEDDQRCDEGLPEETYEVLERWIQGGMLP